MMMKRRNNRLRVDGEPLNLVSIDDARWTGARLDPEEVSAVIALRRRWLVSLMLLLVVSMTAAACSRNSESSATATATAGNDSAQVATEPSTGDQSPTAPAAGSPATTPEGQQVPIPELVTGGNTYVGQAVQTYGNVDTVLSSNVIVLADKSQQLLVFGSADVMPANLTVDEFMLVSGTVEPFDQQHISGTLGIGFDGLDVARFAGKPALTIDAARAGSIPVDEALADAEALQGLTIEIGGQITSIVDTRAFAVSPADAADTSATMLIATPFDAVPSQMAEQARVQVVGRIVVLDDAEDLGDDFEFLNDAAFDQYRGSPIFLADVVNVVAPAPSATVADILASPDSWIGKEVSVIDTVASRLTDRAASISGEPGMMVIGPAALFTATIQPGVMVMVTGTVQFFDSTNPPDVDGFDPQHPAVAAYAGQPIIVATSVQALGN